MSEIWNPKDDECRLLSYGENILVEEIDEAEDKSDLSIGKIVSAPHEEWIENICEHNRLILFKKNNNIFGFTSSYDKLYHFCYVIKAEDILGLFFKEEKK